ncbi:MAG: lamin tail domain-containing protein [Planctomycetes bacterium]|nr:lamin tail domain-containing protein [Planctomycetota bacterium]
MLAAFSAVCLSLGLCLAAPQGNLADPPQGLTIVVVDVGQGDGIVVRAPDGTVHVVDAGPEGEGTLAMLPAIGALQPSGYGYSVVSHFHVDHMGGMDEVRSALPFQLALDRGDVNRPANSSMTGYLNAAGAQRQTIVVGRVYQLGGGAVMRCVCANGEVDGGAFVNPANSSQEENSRSIGLRIDYGDFSMFLAGDLTGGGGSTADVESSAVLACGDVDVYKLSHHGSTTSTNLNLMAALQPELAVVSCGVGNSYGHPSPTIVNRVNQALAARALLSTTRGSANTIGFGVTGDVRVDTDGRRYRATAHNGDFLDFFCDEVIPSPMAAGDVRISEVQRNPAAVADTNGEYVEVVNIGEMPVALAGLRLGDDGGTITLASNFMLVPGRPMLFQVDGAAARNGGQPLGMALPYNTLSLGDSSDVVTLQQGAVLVDSLGYASGFPGGSGVAAERRDLLGPELATNYQAATTAYGAGDLGSPGQRCPNDQTVHPVQCGVTVRPDRFTLHGTALDHAWHFSVFALSNSAVTGFPFGGAWIPVDPDALLSSALSVAGFVDLVPPLGYRSLDVMLPQPNPLTGVTLHVAHVVLDINLNAPGVSPARAIVLP